MKKKKYCIACEAKEIQTLADREVYTILSGKQKVPLCNECIEELKNEIILETEVTTDGEF